MMAACAFAAAEKPSRPAPRFERKTIPERSGLGRPWTLPETLLPDFLLDSTADLFDQGGTDPRGCEYRRVGREREAAASMPDFPAWQGLDWGPEAGRAFSPYGSSGVVDRSPLKLVLLIRLGRADLAETLLAADPGLGEGSSSDAYFSVSEN